jgi:hypothetical protein
MRLFIALLSCFVCVRAIDDFPFRFQTLDVIGGEDASGLSNQSKITATYCSEILDSTFFDIAYGDPDFVNRFFCADYLLDRRVQLTPRLVFPFFFFAETLLIPEHDREAKERYLNDLNSLSTSYYISRLKAHICSRAFPPCDDFGKLLVRVSARDDRPG